jgi:hypothetical protein
VQIDDRQTPMTESHIAVLVNALAVRAAMRQGVEHAPHVTGSAVPAADNSCYSAHRATPRHPPRLPCNCAVLGGSDAKSINAENTVNFMSIRGVHYVKVAPHVLVNFRLYCSDKG